MPIVTQSASASHSHFPAAQLLLPAPHIAGLLPAHVQSSQPPPEPPPAPFVFDRPNLADLSQAQRERLYHAADILLDSAIEFMVGTFSEEILRAAEVLFHRAAGGKSTVRPLGPAAYNAEVDADWLEMLTRAKRSRPITPAQAETALHKARAQRK